MKYVRFATTGGPRYGVLEGDTIHELAGDLFGSCTRTGNTVPVNSVKLLAPVVPGKVILIGLNYVDHAAASAPGQPGDPIIFMAAPSALVADGEPVRLLHPEHQNEHEAELVVVVGKEGRDIPEEKAWEYIFGYTIGNDVSDRTIQKLDGQWTRAKSFPTFKPLGPVIETDLDAGNAHIRLLLNGAVKQDSHTSRLIHGIPKLIRVISECMTLSPGDVIYTGTPSGCSSLKPGDLMEIEIEGIGRLRNPVV